MTRAPIPVIFKPLLKAKPWGGQRLASLLDKPLPPGQPIGEHGNWSTCRITNQWSATAGWPARP